jgi:hypothetical protein
MSELRERVARALWDDAEKADRREEERYSWDYVIEHAILWPASYGPIRDRYYARADAVLAVLGETTTEWGVRYEGRGVFFGSAWQYRIDAEMELGATDDKHQPATLVSRRVHPWIEAS